MSIPEPEELQKLQRLHQELVKEVRDPIEAPEPSMRLNLAARAGDEGRIARHLHQSCSLHSLNFHLTSRYKLPHLTESYLIAADGGSLFGLYSSARALVEFSAFTYQVVRRLRGVCSKRDEHWRGRGEEYFGLIVRARYGTSDPTVRALLIKEGGISKRHIEPFQLPACLKSLADHPEFRDVLPDYDRLCDFVHHNASSQVVVNSGFLESRVARSAAGGAIVSKRPGPVLRYEYPASERVRVARLATAPIALKHAEAVIRWMRDCPESPFTREELLALTGHPLGMGAPGSVPGPPSHFRLIQSPDVGRNDPCPCGSGMKFKQCHGSR
jgi:hypothetical protein